MLEYFPEKVIWLLMAVLKDELAYLVEFDSSYRGDEEYQRKSELYDKIREEAEQFLNSEVGK